MATLADHSGTVTISSTLHVMKPRNLFIMELRFEHIREVQFEILLVLRKVFEELGISYFIDFGTLLGACRHQGFIPWDDDVDISTSPEGMALLAKSAHTALPPHLHLGRNSVFGAATKVQDARYLLTEKTFAGGQTTAFPGVDIFPFGGFKQAAKFLPTKIPRKVASARYSASTKARAHLRKGNRLKAAGYAGISAIPQGAIDRYSRLIQLPSGTDWHLCPSTALLGHTLGSGFGPELIPYGSVFPLRNVDFQGMQFPGPHDPDFYLTRLYGDWRKLPPPELRRPPHFISARTVD